MVALPDDTPATTPVLLTVATDVLLLVHVPPVAPSVRVVEEPAQTVLLPLIVPESGNGLTVTGTLATAIPQLLVTL